MKKTPIQTANFLRWRERGKMLLGMSQLLILLLVFNVNLSAKAFSQHQKVSVTLKNAGIAEFIEAIKSQCDVGFIYDYNKIKNIPSITIDVKNKPIKDVLNQALQGSGFIAIIEDNTIIFQQLALQTQTPQATTIKGLCNSSQGKGNVIISSKQFSSGKWAAALYYPAKKHK